MAVNCTECAYLHDAKTNDHCDHFPLIPIMELDECKLHSKYNTPKPQDPLPDDRLGYIWLNVARENPNFN